MVSGARCRMPSPVRQSSWHSTHSSENQEKMNRSADLLCCVLVVLVATQPGIAFAQEVSNGDHVVAVTTTPVKSKSETLMEIAEGTKFTVRGTQGSWVLLSQVIMGKKVTGWVTGKDVLAIGPDLMPEQVANDDLLYGTGKGIGLPKGRSVEIVYQSTHPIDTLILSEAGRQAYGAALAKRTVPPPAIMKRLNQRAGTLHWTPPDENSYHLILDNSGLIPGGTDLGRNVSFKVALTTRPYQLDERRSEKGLMIGRASLDYDGFNDLQGPHGKPLRVSIQALKGGKDGPLKREVLQTWTDTEGYFFLDNVDRNCKYRIESVGGVNFEVPITIHVRFRFPKGKRVTSATMSWVGDSPSESMIVNAARTGSDDVVDLGHVRITVDKNGNTVGSMTGPNALLGVVGKDATFRGRPEEFPLKRHAWFIENHADSAWSKRVAEDRDLIVSDWREEARKEEEKAKR